MSSDKRLSPDSFPLNKSFVSVQVIFVSKYLQQLKKKKHWNIKKQRRHYMDTSYKQENLHLCSPGFTINYTKVPRKKNAEDTAPSIKIVSPRATSDWMFYHRQSWVVEKKKLIHSSWLVKNCNNHVIPLRFCHFRALWFVMLCIHVFSSFLLLALSSTVQWVSCVVIQRFITPLAYLPIEYLPLLYKGHMSSSLCLSKKIQ